MFLFCMVEVAVSTELPEDEHTIGQVVNRGLSKIQENQTRQVKR
jgi:hypothetical protein